MRKIVLFITFIASSAMLQAQEYLSLGYGASYGYIKEYMTMNCTRAKAMSFYLDLLYSISGMV